MDARTFADLLLDRGDDDRVALLFEDEAWSWRRLIAESLRRADLMLSRRSGREQLHVGVLLENTPDYVAWIYGAAFARATVVGINPTRRGESLAADIRHTECDLIVTDAQQHALIADLDTGVGASDVLLVDSADHLAELDAASTEVPAITADGADLLLLLFTSGSTGAPKAVICTTGRLALIAVGAVQSLGILPGDRLYQAMPLFHGNAIMSNLAPAVALGAPVSLRRRFSASGFLADVRRFDATYFNYVGRSLAYVLATPELADDADNSLRLGFGTEASLVDRREFTRRFGCSLLESYGSSEGVIATWRPDGTPDGSIGMPRPRPGSDVAVVDPSTGVQCPNALFDASGRLLNGDEAIGEIVDRGGAVGFEGYWRNDEAMAERLHDGFYWSGDLAYRDASGFLYFAGRGNDWLRVDSENFASAPIEAVLSRHPEVVMAAVYAVPDPQTGDEVMAAIELLTGASFDAAAFGEFLALQGDLGTKWAPRFVRVVARMPLTATNKVDKAPLRRVGWVVDDPVYFRPGADLAYRDFTSADRTAYRARFIAQARESLLPAD